MRIVTDASIEFELGNGSDVLLGPGARTYVLQSSDVDDLIEQFDALQSALAAESTSWTLSFVDLIGAGDGSVFTLITEWFNTTVDVDVEGSGIQVSTGTVVLGSQAAQSEALILTDLQARSALQVDPGGNYEFVQTDLAGSSSGRRFMNQYFGRKPPPN